MGRFSKVANTAVKPALPNRLPIESRMPLEEIQPRDADTRPLNSSHVEALSESIAAVGLIQPLAVDINGKLLAGGHREAAIELLQESNPDVFDKWFGDGVPVHKFDFDATEDPDRALAIEASENEKRRDYTPGEVRELADRLVAAGYRKTEGRPKKGEKALAPTLAIIVGKSQRTIERYLANADKKTPTGDGVSQQPLFNGDSLHRQVKKHLKHRQIPKRVKELLKELEVELLNE